MVGATGIEPVTPTMSTYSGQPTFALRNRPFPEAGQRIATYSLAVPFTPIQPPVQRVSDPFPTHPPRA
jgi:hypothetical protein